MKLHYTESGNARKYSLPREEEQRLADQGPEFIEAELKKFFSEFRDSSIIDILNNRKVALANTLVWIWVQMEPERVKTNLRICMARKGIFSLNQISKAVGMNGSFMGRMFGMADAQGFGGWNVMNVYRLAKVFDARPELLLTANLSEVVTKELK